MKEKEHETKQIQVSPITIIRLLSKGELMLSDVDNHSLEMVKAAVGRNARQLMYAKVQDEEVCVKAVSVDPVLWHDCLIKTELVSIATLTQNGSMIRFMENPTHDMMMTAVTNQPLSIRFIDNPPDSVKATAIHYDKNAYRYVKGVNDAIIDAVIKRDINQYDTFGRIPSKTAIWMLTENIGNYKYIKKFLTEDQKVEMHLLFENIKEMEDEYEKEDYDDDWLFDMEDDSDSSW